MKAEENLSDDKSSLIPLNSPSYTSLYPTLSKYMGLDIADQKDTKTAVIPNPVSETL